MYYFFNKRVLVTGATGLIGSNLVNKLMTIKGVKVIASSRSYDKLKNLFSGYLKNPLFSIYPHDVSDSFDLEEFPIDIIFHAASPQENKIIRDTPVDVINPNIFGTINCLELLKKQEKKSGVKGRLVLFSSVTIYANDSKLDKVVNETDTSVTDKLENDSAPYSQSKRISEVIANAYKKQFDSDTVIARISTVYGDSKFKTETAFFDFIQKAIYGQNLSINNPLVPRRDNIYIDDALDALLIIAERGISGDSYNVSSNKQLGNFASVYEIAKNIVDITNEFRVEKNLDLIKFNTIPSDLSKRNPGLILDNSKLQLLGWNLKISLLDGLRKTIIKNLEVMK